MPISKPIYFALLFVLTLLSTAAAQESNSPATQTSSLTITANASGDRLRVTAPSSVMQMRLEVYAATGVKLFDEELHGGNVFDWHLQDGQAQRLPAGDYVCVITAKAVSGKITQKVGAVTVAENSASVRAGDAQQFTSPQAQAIGPVEANSSWTIVAEGENKTTTVIANTGSEGQMIRGRGALTFRLGDFFSGKDEEQMRLTEEGNLGIGTAMPQAKLDVAGTIRAERFLLATPSKSGGDKTMAATATTDASNSFQPLVSGAGITGKLTKWTDGPNGMLGDSVITETPVVGNVGIGTTSPNAKLDVSGGIYSGDVVSGFTGLPAGTIALMRTATSPAMYMGQSAVNSGQIQWVFNATAANAYLNIGTAGSNPLILNRGGGNVGIGTTSPGGLFEIWKATSPAMYITRDLSGASGKNQTLVLGIDGSGGRAYIDSTHYSNGGYPLDFRIRGKPYMTVDVGGNVGIGTTSPQQNLSVNGAMNVDQANLNGGSFGPGISFGSGSGEGIASNRICGLACIINPQSGNHFGLDFYTNFLNRMSITNGGNVGIGTNNPGAPLDVQVAAGQSLQFRQDGGLVPGINVKTTGGNAGIMRFRNSIEVWPSDDGTRAGKVSVWNTAASPTISLDGQTGNLSATGDASFRNMPGIQFSQSDSGGALINSGLTPVAIDSVTVNAPAAGFIFVTAFVYAETSFSGDYLFDFTLSNEGANLVNTKAQSQTSEFASDGKVPVHLSWVIPVASAGALHLKTTLFYDSFDVSSNLALVKSHNLTAIYLPKQY